MGGYNSIIELSTSLCLRTYRATQADPFVVGLLGAAPFRELAAGLPQDIRRGPIERLLARSSLSRVSISAVLTPIDLRFESAQVVHVRFHGSLSIEDGDANVLGPTNEGGGGGPEAAAWNGSRKAERAGGGSTEVGETAWLDRLRLSDFGDAAIATRAELLGGSPRVEAIGGPIGDVMIEVALPFDLRVDRAAATVDLALRPLRASVHRSGTIMPVGPLVDALVGPGDRNLIDALCAHGTARLAPTISLVGSSDFYSAPPFLAPRESWTVREFDVFNVAPTVVERSGAQALALLVMVEEGRIGTASGIEHFIGDADYGVMSDEQLVRRVFMYKWRLCGFSRSLPAEARLTVQRHGRAPEVAMVVGHLSLDTLEEVEIVSETMSGEGYVLLAGKSTAHVERLRFSDGTILEPASLPSNLIDIGDVRGRPWAVAATIPVHGHFDSDPELQQWQRAAFWDAFRHLQRPFARQRPYPGPPDIHVLASTIDPSARTVRFLGRMAR